MTILVDGELVLYGFVGESYFVDGFTSQEVIEALAEIDPQSELTVRINSGGGYAFEGIAIYNSLKARKGKVRVEIDAIAASAASVIAMAGDEIVMRSAADIMIHDASTITFGTEDDHLKSIEVLGRLGSGMAGIYADQSGEDPAAIRKDMKAELWLNGKEAVDRGYATESEDRDPEETAAFPYQFYARAPQRLKALASTKGWATGPQARLLTPTATAKPPEKEPPKMSTQQNGQPAVTPEPAAPAPATAVAPAPVAPAAQSDPAVAATATAEGVKQRIQAITDCEEAKGREVLAKHLAFNTELPVDDAIAALKAATADAGAQDPETPPVAAYQQQRTAAAAVAQPAAPTGGKPAATIDTAAIYRARRNAKTEA